MATAENALPNIKYGAIPSYDLDSYVKNNYSVHGIHPYPAKFIPQIPAALVRALTTPGDTILDPFCGSGTTVVESVYAGRKSIGVDVNPIACLVSRAKWRPLTTKDFTQLDHLCKPDWIIELSRSVDVEKVLGPFHNRDKWFSDTSLRELAAIKQICSQITGSAARDFSYVALSAIVVRASNQDSETRWKAVEKAISVGDVARSFVTKLSDNLKRNKEYSKSFQGGAAKILQSDTRRIAGINDGIVDAVITSPPYMNSFDYYLYHKLRMFVLGFDHKPVQEIEIGSRNKHNDKKLPTSVFVESMTQCMNEIHRTLKHGAFVALVVGDSILRGEVVRMDAIYDEVCEMVGLAKIDHRKYSQRRYTRAFTANLRQGKKETHILLYQKS